MSYVKLSNSIKKTFEVMYHGITINRILGKILKHHKISEEGEVGLCSKVFCIMLISSVVVGVLHF